MTAPSLSLLIFCRNHERFVANCVRSVLEAADQDCQLVFFDNGSRDRSVEIATAALREAPPQVRCEVVSQVPELPLCRALNVAHTRLTGEIVKPVSADDMLGPNFFPAFRRLVEISAPDVGLWLAGAVTIDENDRVLRRTYSPDFGFPDVGPPVYLRERDVIARGAAPPIETPSMWYRRRSYDEVGGFDERFRYEDKPFYFNLLKHGWKIVVHPYNNTYYRAHGAGISANAMWMAEARLPVILDHALRSQWRNKPLAISRLVRGARYVALGRWRAWRERH